MERFNILGKLNSYKDLRNLSYKELKELSEEIRAYILEVTSKNGGHVAPSLGVVELTIALLRVFSPPDDVIVWDIGHQAYPWKILTDRKESFKTLRKKDGISGFLRRHESLYDAFGAGHSSTSISAALGFRVGKDIKSKYKLKALDGWTIAVIGDGSMTAGMAFEAINNVGNLKPNRFLIILNDNEMSISKNVGAISSYLNKIITGHFIQETRTKVKHILDKLGFVPKRFAKLTEEFIKGFATPGIIFEELGLTYIGYIDGHDIETLERTLQNIKSIEGPLLLHVVTKKGKGYKPAEENPIKWHGASPYKIESGEALKKGELTWTNAVSDILTKLGKENEKVVVITPAMKEGSGLVKFSEEFPDRFFDVGIAEQHAATFSAGLAAEDIRPILCYYSTFMQRAYDQLIHDIALQKLAVTILVDRAGLVGEDGPTHHGVFDISFMRCIPNVIISSPKDTKELQDLIYTSLTVNSPFVIRYPRGEAIYKEYLNAAPKILKIGSWEILKEGNTLAIITYSYLLKEALEAAIELEKNGISVSVINARFIKPLDEKLLRDILLNHSYIITVEDHVKAGGFGSSVLEFMAREKIFKPIEIIGIEDEFVEHGTQKELRSLYSLNKEGIKEKSLKLLEQYIAL